MHHPFQIARWALFASFAVMVFVVAFPNPSPGRAWKLAEKLRYEKRFPALRKGPEATIPPETQLAKRPLENPKTTRATSEEPAEKPVRTAHLPARLESGDDLPMGVRIQEPIFFEDEGPAKGNLAPDPSHLETPSSVINP